MYRHVQDVSQLHRNILMVDWGDSKYAIFNRTIFISEAQGSLPILLIYIALTNIV